MSIAHGTIAFDTLTTSDQVNTNTEKSIDTSYIFNGVAKAWADYSGAGTTYNDSLLEEGMKYFGEIKHVREITKVIDIEERSIKPCDKCDKEQKIFLSSREHQRRRHNKQNIRQFLACCLENYRLS